MGRKTGIFLATLPGLLLLGGGFFLPLLLLFIQGLGQVPGQSIWSDPYFWRILSFTYLQAFLSALLAGGLGLAGALLYSEQSFWWRTLLWRVGLVSFSLPTLLAVLGYLGVWGNRGWVAALRQSFNKDASLQGLYGFGAILIVHVFLNFSLFLRYVGTALSEMDRREERAALSLGASRFMVFIQVTLVKLIPSISSAFLLSFLYCSYSFLVVLLLGGGPRYTSIEVGIFEATKMNFDLPLAVRLAAVQLLVSGAVFWALFRLQKGEAGKLHRDNYYALFRFHRGPANLAVRATYFLVLLLLVIFPLASLGISGLESVGHLEWPSVLMSLVTSVGIAFGVGLLSGMCALGMAWASAHIGTTKFAKALTFAATAPTCVSSILFTLSLFIAYPSILIWGKQHFLGVLLVQSVLAIPLVFRPIRDRFSAMDSRLAKTAYSLGANVAQTFFWVEWPFLRRAFFVGLLFGMTFSLGEMGSLLMLIPQGEPPLAVAIYRAMAQYQFPQAYALGFVLLTLVLVLEGALFRVET